MIRPATLADVVSIVALGRIMVTESWYRHHPYDAEKTAETIRRLIEGEFAVVHEVDGVIDGFLLGYTAELWFSRDLGAFDLGLYVREDRRGGSIAFRLVAAYLDWARVKGATEITISSSCGVEKDSITRLMLGTGFTHVGGVFKRKGAQYV